MLLQNILSFKFFSSERNYFLSWKKHFKYPASKIHYTRAIKVLSDHSGLSCIFSALVYRFIPNLSLWRYWCKLYFSLASLPHYGQSSVLLSKGILPFLFVWASSKEIFISNSRSCNINMPTPCHSLSSLLSQAFYFPAPCHIFSSHEISIYTGLGEKGSFQLQLWEKT